MEGSSHSQFKVKSWHLPGGTEESHKKTCHYSCLPGWDTNPGPSQYEATVLTTRPQCSVNVLWSPFANKNSLLHFSSINLIAITHQVSLFNNGINKNLSNTCSSCTFSFVYWLKNMFLKLLLLPSTRESIKPNLLGFILSIDGSRTSFQNVVVFDK
jgi:hypothetical protein